MKRKNVEYDHVGECWKDDRNLLHINVIYDRKDFESLREEHLQISLFVLNFPWIIKGLSECKELMLPTSTGKKGATLYRILKQIARNYS